MVTAVNEATGEVIELPVENPEQIVNAWLVAGQYMKAAEALRDQLKKLVPALIGERGVSEPITGYAFRQSFVQRSNYDKSIMRELLDEDTYDLLVKPDKSMVDKYLKENLEALGEVSTQLRRSMIPEGSPYQVIKLEKLDR